MRLVSAHRLPDLCHRTSMVQEPWRGQKNLCQNSVFMKDLCSAGVRASAKRHVNLGNIEFLRATVKPANSTSMMEEFHLRRERSSAFWVAPAVSAMCRRTSSGDSFQLLFNGAMKLAGITSRTSFSQADPNANHEAWKHPHRGRPRVTWENFLITVTGKDDWREGIAANVDLRARQLMNKK